MNPAKLKNTIARWDSWWERTNTHPVSYVIFPAGTVDFSPVRRPWMSPQLLEGWSNWKQEMIIAQALEFTLRENDWRYVDEALDLLAYYHEVTGHHAEGFPFYLPGFGPGILAACISDYFSFKDFTVWFELKDPWTLEEIAAFDSTRTGTYLRAALEAARRIVARLGNSCIIAMPDIGHGLDTLAALRGTQNLLMDCLDAPEAVAAALTAIERMFSRVYREFSAIIHPGTAGYTESMRYLSSRPMYISYCDFSAMISPGLFKEFVLPLVKQHAETFGGRTVFHLDGPGEIPHVPHLLQVEKLFAIQWVPGAGNPGCFHETYYPLYRKILDGGKRICLSTQPNSPEELRSFFDKFPRQEFALSFSFNSRMEAAPFQPFFNA